MRNRPDNSMVVLGFDKTKSYSGGFDRNKIVLFVQNKITLRRPQSHLTRKSAKRGVSSSFTGLEKVNLAHSTKYAITV